MKLKWIFLFLLVQVEGAFAQRQLKEYTNLKIGQKIPNVTLANIKHFKISNAKIDDFKGTPLILDFWATWCAPCVAMIPKIDSLQKRFDGKLQLLSITYEKENIVLPFWKKMESQKGHLYRSVPEVIGDTSLHKLFPHYSVPHFVWIDADGTVRGITNAEDLTEEKINKFINGGTSIGKEKKDVRLKFDYFKPLLPFLVGDNGGYFDSLKVHSFLTGYINGLGGGGGCFNDVDTTKMWRTTFRNAPLYKIFVCAYGHGRRFLQDQSVEMTTKDSSKFINWREGDQYLEWATKNTYCYELCISPTLFKSAWQMFANDLSAYFPLYTVKIIKKVKLCLVLERTSSQNKLNTIGGEPKQQQDKFSYTLQNASLDSFLQTLGWKYLVTRPPLVNQTGYSGNVDLVLNANLSNVESLNKELAKYDLRLVEKNAETDVLVIGDKMNENR